MLYPSEVRGGNVVLCDGIGNYSNMGDEYLEIEGVKILFAGNEKNPGEVSMSAFDDESEFKAAATILAAINRETFEEAERKFQTGEYTITSD